MSTGNPKITRTKRAIQVDPTQDRIRPPASQRRPHLTRKQLRKLRESLLSRRDELIADMVQLDLELYNTQADQDKSDEIECSSKSEEIKVAASMLQAEWHELREINDALDRMDYGIYGICMATGAPIGIERLQARPWAKYCIEYARSLEKSRARKVAG